MLNYSFRRLRSVQVEHVGVVAKARREERQTEIERLAAKLEPAIARAVLDYFNAQASAFELDAILDALKSGDLAKVLAILDAADTAAEKAKVQTAVQDAVWKAGVMGAAGINARITGVTFAFNQLNPRLIDWLQGYSFRLIREIDQGTKEAIRARLVSGMTAGQNPIDVARDVRQVVGLTERQQAAVSAYRKELESFHLRSSAKGYNLGAQVSRRNGRQVYAINEDGKPKDGIEERRLRDFRYDGQLKRAMETGKPLTAAQIDKMVAAYARKYLRHRSETIARTEALRTTNAGVQDAWRQAVEAGKVAEKQLRRRWNVARDERLCVLCAPIPKMNPKLGVAMDQHFATPRGPLTLPPAHPNCRCSVWITLLEPEQLAAGEKT